MTFIPSEKNQKTAFNELLVSELTPVVQLQFPYNTSPGLTTTRTNNSGSVTNSDGNINVATGEGDNSFGHMFSKVPIKYEPGQGSLVRFTAVYTSGTVGSSQWVGLGDVGDGLFFGYEGDTFGIMRRRGGTPEIRTITIDTPSSTDEDITITLDGETKTDITVTNSANATVTANEIAAADFSQVGKGWAVEAVGNDVVFFSFDALPHSGTYNLTGSSTASGSFVQTVTGTVPTEFFISQSAWNEDPADGSSVLPVLDPLQGNVYQIKYQWLGYGALEYFVERPSSGILTLVHRERYAGTSVVPSLFNPTLPLCITTTNTTNTSDMSVLVSSMLGATEGKKEDLGVSKGGQSTVSAVGATELPILTVRNKTVYQDKINREKVQLAAISVANDHNKPIQINLYASPTLVDADYTDVDLASSVMEIASGSSFTDGDLLFSFTVGPDASEILLLPKPNKTIIIPGDHLTATAKALSGVGAVVTVTFNWIELF